MLDKTQKLYFDQFSGAHCIQKLVKNTQHLQNGNSYKVSKAALYFAQIVLSLKLGKKSFVQNPYQMDV